MKRLADRLLAIFSSLGTSCVLLLFLGLLTWLGTLEQVHSGLYEVQKKYFESFFLVHHAGPVPIPLPGANLVLCLLFVNILVGGIVRLRMRRSTVGILVTHLGIAFLLTSGFVKMYFSDDGHVTLFEGEASNSFQSYHRWELAVTRDLGDGRVREYLVPQEDFLALSADRVTLTSDELPFDIEVGRTMVNCRRLPKGPMFDVDVPVVGGDFLQAQPRVKESERNVAGAYVTLVAAGGERQQGLLWGLDSAPFRTRVGGEEWAVTLRKERYPMPFTLALDDFTKEDHPRTGMPKSFSSDVTVTEGASSRPVKISMNEPLRTQGLVLYQASWGPSTARPGDPLFSTLAVVRNPADDVPLYACLVIAAGLVLHFSRMLLRYVRAEVAAS